VAAALLLLAWRHRNDARTQAARVAPIVVVALLVNTAMLRPPLSARLPDAIVPALMLAAWLCAGAWRARSPVPGRAVAVAVAIVLSTSVVAAARTGEHLARARLLQPVTRWPAALLDAEATLLTGLADEMIPSRTSRSLLPFYAYVKRCTPADHRLLVIGFVPEAPFFAQRPFAGGQVMLLGGYFEAERYQQSVLRRLRRQTVPFVLIAGEGHTTDLEKDFPLIAEHVRGRYTPLATVVDDVGRNMQLVLDSTLPIRGRDATTGWPCLR
jgi:hypothetical protein